MAEYIERVNYCKNICLCSEDLCEKEKCPIWRASTADVEPVRHRHWVYGEYDIPHCSECGHEIMPNQISPYCPNCGARMDGDKNGA